MESFLLSSSNNVPGKSATQSAKGTILHVVKGSGKNFSSESYEVFSLFSLDVKGNSNFGEAFKTFLVPDLISGYNTETELGIIDIEKYRFLDKSPRLMIVQLKRFDFDINIVERKNINSYFQFPLEAVFTPFSMNPREKKYHLVGIVIDSRSAMGGHYYTYTKSQKDCKCYCYNDYNVTEVKYSEEELCR